MSLWFALKIDVLFFNFLKIFKLQFLIQDFISWLIVNENGIYIYQNLSLGVDNQKQIKFWKLKMWALFNGSPGMPCFDSENNSQLVLMVRARTMTQELIK